MLQDENNPVFKAFHKGYLQREVEMKKEMLELTDPYLKEFSDKTIRNFKAKLKIQIDDF